MSIPNLLCIEYGHLEFWTETWFREKPFILSIQNLLCIEYGHLNWRLSQDMIWGKPFCFVHPNFAVLYMFIPTLEPILIWVLVLVLDMKVLDVLKYFLKRMSTWPVLVLGKCLGYLVYLSTWSTVLDPNPDVLLVFCFVFVDTC